MLTRNTTLESPTSINLPTCPVNSPQSDRNISPLTAYVESHSQAVLHLDEQTGKICWIPASTLQVDDRDQSKSLGHKRLSSQSRTTTPFKTKGNTGHAMKFPRHFRTAFQPLYRIRSSLADEGLVGLICLWKWVKRMIAQHQWQESVVVALAPKRHTAKLQWYNLGIKVTDEYTTPRVHHKVWKVSTALLLAADLETCSPFDMTVGQYLSFFCKRNILISKVDSLSSQTGSTPLTPPRSEEIAQ